jgi:MFS transporter, AAHS family, vanillate permease
VKLNKLISCCFVLAALLFTVFCFVIRDISDKDFVVLSVLTFSIGLTLNGGFANLFAVALNLYPATIKNTGLGWCRGLGRGGAIISPALAGVLLLMGGIHLDPVAHFRRSRGSRRHTYPYH